MEKSGESVFCKVFAHRSEMHEHTSAISRIGVAFDEPGCLKAVESDCHPPAGQEEIPSQLGWGQRPDELELGEGLEVPPMAEPVGRGDVVESHLNQVGGSQHPSSDFERREVQVRAGSSPPLEHVAKTVGHVSSCYFHGANVIAI